jgi:glycosyltransferase involved in cell wall biosynthesis
MVINRPTTGSDLPITLVGHPFSTVGMGEQLRSHIAACRSVHLPFRVMDVFGYDRRDDPDHRALVDGIECGVADPGGIRIFHCNGDEVEAVLKAFSDKGGDFSGGYNIIVPAWELPVYPAVWASRLRKFDEVWALSRFISDSLAAADIPSTYVGQSIEVATGYFLPRKHFGIRDSAFAILQFFDLSSYSTRKNPEAVLTMFEAIRRKRPFADIQLVLKVKNRDAPADDWLQPLRERLPEAVYVANPLSALETRSLLKCCDCFASLHRSEGFGRGTGEAMFLGRLALATGWSGNMDYMTPENSLLVEHRLVPVRHNEYPFGEGQVWAEADVDHAVYLLEGVLDDPEAGRGFAARGRRDVRLRYSYRAVGVRITDRVTNIVSRLYARQPSTAARRPESRMRVPNKRKQTAAAPGPR